MSFTQRVLHKGSFKKCQSLFPTPTQLQLDLWMLVIVGVHKAYEFKASSQWCQVHNLETPDLVQSSHFTEGNPNPREIEWIIQGHNAHYSKNGGAAIARCLPPLLMGNSSAFVSLVADCGLRYHEILILFWVLCWLGNTVFHTARVDASGESQARSAPCYWLIACQQAWRRLKSSITKTAAEEY